EHIVTETTFYLDEADHCLLHPENAEGQMTPEGTSMFQQNGFPDIRITRDESLSQTYPQPISASDIKQKMQQLKLRLNASVREAADRDYPGGKTKHPGLGHFSALEWIRFAEMHMRHHLRQKARIEQALNLS
ncbi:MAG TPA: DinB family protein, partial [Chitinophagaceae bacterium]